MEKEGTKKGLFRSLFGGAEKQEKKLKAEEDQQAAEQAAPTDEEQERKKALVRAAALPPFKGSLLQIWQKWEAGSILSPTQSLIDGLSEEEIIFDVPAMEREALRLTVQLEQAAKKRMMEIDKLEKAGSGSLNAQVNALISQDKMMAWLFVFPPFGDSGEFPVESLGSALKNSRVTTGINQNAVIRIFEKKLYCRIIPVAIGTPAVQGMDGTVTELFERELEREVQIDDEGMADYKYTNYVRQIAQGDVICEMTLPVPGKAGVRVDGTVVEPKAVKPAAPPKGTNTTVTEDGLQMVATIDGHLEFSNHAFNIRPVLTVQGDVDYGSGNINFIGDVHVTGDVRENFEIIASGSVTVDGLVEAAHIEAGGDLIITRGVVGDNRAMIRSAGVVRAKYLENCVVYANKGLHADCIMNSQVFSDSFIEVISGRGSIIGGTMTAAESIRAKAIGAKSGRRTDLVLGVLPYVQNELQDIYQDLERNRAEKEQLERDLSFMERQQGLEGSDARLARARMRKSVLEMKEQKLHKRLERLEPLSLDITKCRLESVEVYPVTTLTVGDHIWKATEYRSRCKVIYSAEEHDLKEIFV